jgi:response regulator RpfG family c-di-GMP phosphodiesterase
MNRFSNYKLTDILTIITVVVFLSITTLTILLVNHNMKEQALREAEAKAHILIDRNMATHTYFSHILKPRLFEWTAPFRTPEYFDPSWMSSTYAIREIHKYFNSLNPAGYYIKDAAINARSPENEADDYERAFLDKLNNDKSLESYSEIRVLNGKPYFVVLKRGESMEESCLRCHSTPGNAPKDLLKHYDPERSFHRKAGDLVSTISLRIPLSAAYEGMNQTSMKLSVLLAIVLAFLFGVQIFIYRRFLLSPIGIIRDKAIEIAGSEEHLGEKIPEPFGKELRDLSDAFNEMSVKLRIGRDHLEDRIEERTGELKTSNEQLQQEINQRRQMEKALEDSHGRLERNLKGTIDVISETIELKGPYAPGHHQRVTRIASAVAAEMGLTDFQVKGIELAAAVYDIGLIHIPIEFLQQDADKLDGIKLTMYQGYPTMGYNMLKQIEFPWPIAEMTLQHRENYDGSGFPKGIKGEDILIEARVLAIADAIEDLTVHRIYREALAMDKALEIVSKGSGTLYDPAAVEACLGLFNEKGYKLA